VLLTCLSCNTMPILISKKRGKVMRCLLNKIADATAIQISVADFRCYDHSCCLVFSSAGVFDSLLLQRCRCCFRRLTPPGAIQCRLINNASDAPQLSVYHRQCCSLCVALDDKAVEAQHWVRNSMRAADRQGQIANQQRASLRRCR
jgi:hypothetical protein